MRTPPLASWFLFAVAALVLTLGACAGGTIRREIDRESATAAGLVEQARGRAADAAAAVEARAAVTAEPKSGAAVLAGLRAKLTDAGRRDLDAALAAGMTPASALESVGVRAESAAKPLIEQARAAGDRIEALAARLPAADAADDGWWGLGETGAAVLAAALPGLGAVIGGAFGLARGAARGRKIGAADVTELVASLRKAVPAIDRAFRELPTGAAAAAMAGLHPDVAKVVDAGRTSANHAIVADVVEALGEDRPRTAADGFPAGGGGVGVAAGAAAPVAAAGRA